MSEPDAAPEARRWLRSAREDLRISASIAFAQTIAPPSQPSPQHLVIPAKAGIQSGRAHAPEGRQAMLAVYNSPSYKSSHSGFSRSIKASFHSRRQALICLSRVMAPSIESWDSTYTSMWVP